MKNKNIYLLSLGHLCADLNQGALSALLPFIVSAYFFSYAKASSLVLFANLIGSMVQPVIGHISDKKDYPWIMPLGLLLAGAGMALTGFSASFSLLAIGVLISGLGIAMFHPQAAKTVNTLASQNQKGSSLSLFSFGGNIGFSLGPLYTTIIISTFGLKGSIWFFAPQLLFSISYKQFKTQPKLDTVLQKTKYKDNWKQFAKLCILIFSRSIVLYGVNTFLALYFINHFGLSKSNASILLSLFFAFSALSTLFGGHLADKHGQPKIITFSFLLLSVSFLLFSITSHLVFAKLILIPLAIGLSLSYSPMVSLGQAYLPNHVGLASGVTLGLAVSIGGLFAPILGLVGDHFGLSTTIKIIALITLIPALFSFFLEKKSNFSKHN